MENLVIFAERVALLRDKAAEGNALSAAALPAAEALLVRAKATFLRREAEKGGILAAYTSPQGWAAEEDWSVSL